MTHSRCFKISRTEGEVHKIGRIENSKNLTIHENNRQTAKHDPHRHLLVFQNLLKTLQKLVGCLIKAKAS